MTLCTLLGLWCALSGPARIIDGDTLVIGSTHVRLAGIDAEELMEPNGYRAKVALQMMTAGLIVACYDRGEKSYGRVVATCWNSNKREPMGSINAQMIRNGYALDCARYSGGKYREIEPAGIRAKLKQKPYC